MMSSLQLTQENLWSSRQRNLSHVEVASLVIFNNLNQPPPSQFSIYRRPDPTHHQTHNKAIALTQQCQCQDLKYQNLRISVGFYSKDLNAEIQPIRLACWLLIPVPSPSLPLLRVKKEKAAVRAV